MTHTVMLLDDHPLQLKMLDRALRQLGVSDIHSFTSVDAAMASLSERDYQLILCDLSMPGRDGIDMLEALNEAGFAGHVAILSGLDQPVLSTVKAMCQGYSFDLIAQISKPFVEAELSALFSYIKPAPRTSVQRALTLTDAEFLLALAAGDICNFYQPQVDFNTGEVVGVEALARWQHPEHGTLFPDTFLPMVERCQLSNELFDTVLLNALMDMQQGLLPAKVSVNADQANLENPNFADHVLTLCRQHRVDPQRLTIEITEEYSYQKNRALYKNLAKLRVNHINVAIDDFGTGYSSLENLYAFPFNEIKIDRTFVLGLENDTKKQRIVTFISQLAQSFNIHVVAEGVETKQSWDVLRGLSVHTCQGYLVSKPVPLAELPLCQPNLVESLL
ncbi:EAL domain-containing response regulator [Vibrio cholerae]